MLGEGKSPRGKSYEKYKKAVKEERLKNSVGVKEIKDCRE